MTIARRPTIEALCVSAMCSPDSAHIAGADTFGEEVKWFVARLKKRGHKKVDESAVAMALLDRDSRRAAAKSVTVGVIQL